MDTGTAGLSATESVFDPPPPGIARIACLAGPRFPDPAFADAYATADGVAAVLGADVAVWHWFSADPRGLPPALRARVGTGMLPRPWLTLHEDDRRHLRTTMPERFAQVLARLARELGVDEAGVLARWDVRIGCALARWLCGWRADALLSWPAGRQTVAASIAADLLQLPHVLFLDAAALSDARVRLLPGELRSPRALVVTTSPDARERALAVAPGLEAAHLVDVPEGADGIRALASHLRFAMAARPAGAVARGPRAAFLSAPSRGPARPSGAGPAPVSPVRLFVVLSTERSGSNALVGLLDAQQTVGCAGELFNPRLIDSGTAPWIGGGPVPADASMVDDDRPVRILTRLAADAAARGKRMAGFKLLYDHAAIDTRIADALAQHPNLPIVHLVRRDRLARFVSHQFAKRSDQWSEGEPADPSSDIATPRRLVVDVEEALDDLAATELMEHRFRALFATHPTLEVAYEEVASDWAGLAGRLSEFLGEPIEPVLPPTRKTGRPLHESVENLDDLREALHRTRWQHLAGNVDRLSAETPGPGHEPHDYYQSLDAPHFDYRPVLVPGAGDRPFRGPLADLSGSHVACLGAAQTFGRFVQRPFPALLARHLCLPCLNLGSGGVGPRFWTRPTLLAVLSRARVVVVQVMAARSASNSLFDNTESADLMGRLRSNGERMRFEQFLERLVEDGDADACRRIVDETRDDYVAAMCELAAALPVPTVLLWISRRPPAYTPDWREPFGILQHFPQLVDDRVIARLRPRFDAYVECTSDQGLPQALWPAGAAIDGTRLGPDGLLYNDYYPSQAMHDLAADRLAPVVRALLDRRALPRSTRPPGEPAAPAISARSCE